VDTQIGENARQEFSMDKPGKTVKRKRPRRTFTPEFKAEAVRLCRARDRSIAQVAKHLDLTETALREWVHRARLPNARAAPARTPRGGSVNTHINLSQKPDPLQDQVFWKSKKRTRCR
jgi:transposase-like protein